MLFLSLIPAIVVANVALYSNLAITSFQLFIAAVLPSALSLLWKLLFCRLSTLGTITQGLFAWLCLGARCFVTSELPPSIEDDVVVFVPFWSLVEHFSRCFGRGVYRNTSLVLVILVGRYPAALSSRSGEPSF